MLGRRQLFITGLALTAAAFLTAGCTKKDPGAASSGAPAAANEWLVGAYLSLSGPETQFGIETREGIELAVEQVNKAGGIKGKPMKVLFEDDKTNPQEATNKVLQLIDRDNVVALLGEVASSRSRAGGIVANRKKIPMISPSSTNPDVTKVGPFVFRVCFTDDVQGRMGAEFMVKTMGKKKVGLIYASDDLYSSGLASEFREEVKRLGGEVVAEKAFIKTETNFTTYISEIMSKSPELIYAPIYYSSMVPIARQAKAAGVKGEMFVGGDGWDSATLLADAGEEMEGAYFTNHYAPDVPWENSREFVKAYNEKFNHKPSGLAAQGYDSAKLLADAIGRSKDGTPDSIRAAIQDTKKFQGATGMITIDDNRNADKPIVIVKIKDKQFHYYATVNDKSAPTSAPAAKN